jgi:hypothetical protein
MSRNLNQPASKNTLT